MRATIFVTDDDEAVRSSLTRRLSRRKHHIRGFASGEGLLEGMDFEIPDLVLLDLKMPGMDGLETLKEIKKKAPHVLVILLTAYGTVEDAVEAMKLGAYDFLIKTVSLEGLTPVLNRALEYLKLKQRVSLEIEDTAERYAVTHVIAKSPDMETVLLSIQELMNKPSAPVLLRGELGTGKEYMAHVLHYNGGRKDGPFIGINCTAVQGDIFERQLFGNVRGAFQGASQEKPGLCEQAEGGTLFLDEIGDIPLSIQAKLLWTLQEHSLIRMGGRDAIDVDFRLIAATSRDLNKEVDVGRFHKELFHFLTNAVIVDLPPLRHRTEDVIPLCFRILDNYGKEIGRRVEGIDSQAKAWLSNYGFPGNIRELETIIKRAVLSCHNQIITLEDIRLGTKEEERVL